MFGKRAPPAVEHAPGSYAAVHAKFAQYHQLPGNCNAHAFTLLLGLLGTAGLIIRGCVSLSKDKPRASFARAAAASVWLAYAVALFAFGFVAVWTPPATNRPILCEICAPELRASILGTWVGKAP